MLPPASPSLLGVSGVWWLSAGFQMGLVETLSGGPWWGSAGQAQLPGPFGCPWVCRQSLFISGAVSVTRSPPFPWRPGWVGAGAGDLSPVACLLSETPGVGADGAVSYGPPGPRHPPQCCCSVWAAGAPPAPQYSQGLGPPDLPRASSPPVRGRPPPRLPLTSPGRWGGGGASAPLLWGARPSAPGPPPGRERPRRTQQGLNKCLRSKQAAGGRRAHLG